MLDYFVIGEEEEGKEAPPSILRIVVSFVHMLFWYVVLQFALAILSGAVNELLPTWLHSAFKDGLENKKNIKANLACFSVLIAHMTGFASITAWGTLQHLAVDTEDKRQNLLFWFSVIWPIPVSVLGQYVLQRISDHIRFKISMSDDGKVDEFERMWSEFTEEGENDVMGLSISFMMVQVIRFGISGIFPNTEGAESEADRGEHPVWQVGALCGTAIVFAFVLFVLARFIPSEEEEDDDSDQEPGKEETSEGEGIGENCKRIVGMVTTVISFSMAWCFFFSGRWAIARSSYADSHGMVLALCLTLAVSLIGMGSIRALDCLADADWTPDAVDHAIFKVIYALGYCMGFSWEQAFDEGTDVISHVEGIDPAVREIVKFVLALFCCAVVLPAWRLYILPMILEKGYNFGFVPHNDAIQALIDKKRDKVQGFLNKAGRDIDGGKASPEYDNADSQKQLADLRAKNEQLARALSSTLNSFNAHIDEMEKSMDAMEKNGVTH